MKLKELEGAGPRISGFFFLAAAVVGGWGLLSAARGAPAPSYHVVDLGAGALGGDYSAAVSVNNSGQIAGYARDNTDQIRAVYWPSSGSSPVNLDAGRPAASYAWKINESGQIVGRFGTASGGFHAAYWANSSTALLDLGTFPGGTNSSANGINRYGEIVGYSEGCDCQDGSYYYSAAAYWGGVSAPSQLDYNGSYAYAISDSYGIVGSGPEFNPTAKVWSSGGLSWELGTLGPGACCSAAIDINESGQIVGYDYTSIGQTRICAFWPNLFSAPVALGGLGYDSDNPQAHKINASGQIVGLSGVTNGPGYHAVLWLNSTSPPIDLNLILSNDSGLELYQALGLNDSGEIVGIAVTNGSYHAFAALPDPPLPDVTNCIQNICFVVSGIRATATGTVGSVTLLLPAGFSVGTGPGNRLTANYVNYPAMPLGPDFNPQNQTLTLPGPFYGVHESLPFWFGPSALTWHVDTGQLVMNGPGAFVRQPEDDNLADIQSLFVLAEPDAGHRISNDGYLRGASSATRLTVAADTNGIALITTQIRLAPPELRPHFPFARGGAGNPIATMAGGILILEGGQVSSNSFLQSAGLIPVSYARNCPQETCDGDAFAPREVIDFFPESGMLRFTPDGGLLAYGSNAPGTLVWGFAGGGFAQQAGMVSSGAFLMPGIFLKGDQGAANNSEAPAVLLLTGWGDGANPAYCERLGSNNYSAGLANYAGLNFRAPTTGTSYLANRPIGPYSLTEASKYYVRYGGVSGIHDAGTFPTTPLILYGFPFRFQKYSLSFLDSQNWESRTDGSIAFPPNPAGFTANFERMKFTCRGQLDTAQVPASAPPQHLNYWNVDIRPLAIEFRPHDTGPCDLGDRFLVLGVEMTLPLIPQALHATLGFKPNGNLVTPVDHAAGNVDSRFALPAHLSLNSSGSSAFPLYPASEGYFNNWETAEPINGALPPGYFNIVGKLRVPFFTDIKVHLHVTPISASRAGIDVMGGWTAADSQAPDLGWSDGSQNFFNTTKFDPNNSGWPTGMPLRDYRKSPDNTHYRARAQRDWLDVAHFDYPLDWNPLLESLEGAQDAKVGLPVVDVSSHLTELSPGKIDLDFAQDMTFQLNLPRIKLPDIQSEIGNGVETPLFAVSNALYRALSKEFDAVGINELQRALQEDATGFFTPLLTSALSQAGILDKIFTDIAGSPQAVPADFLAQAYQVIAGEVAGPLHNALETVNYGSNQVNGVVGTLDKTLRDVDDTIGLLLRILQKADPPDGKRHGVRIIVEKLVSEPGENVTPLIANLADEQVDPLLDKIEPTLAKIQTELEEVRAQLQAIRGSVSGAAGDFNSALGTIVNDASLVTDYLQTAGNLVTNYLATVVIPGGDFFTADVDAAKQAIANQLVIAFLSSAMPASYQTTMRSFLSDPNFLLDQLMSALFDQINKAVRDAVGSLAGDAQDTFDQLNQASAKLNGTIATAKVRGLPLFNGDSLQSIHLDAAVRMLVPTPMNFQAYLDINALNSQSTPLDCIPTGDTAAEITLGAQDVPLDWPGVTDTGKGMTLSAETRWTLQQGNVIGLGGKLDLKGKADLEACSLKELGVALAFGSGENYFAGKGKGSVVVFGYPLNVEAGIFAGRACSLVPLTFVDPEAAAVLHNPVNYSGVYVHYGAGLHLIDSSSCLLDANAYMTTAFYWQGGKGWGAFGGRQKMGIDATLLCVVGGSVNWAEFIRVDTAIPSFTVGGSAEVCGEIGYCPVCRHPCFDISISGTLTPGGVDYNIDF
jgi:uncharacterized membrane protein